ncbi:tetrahydrofolate dehydrogenase/cyclohydrolase catalytic domain-containing protein [uncultured Pseudonocardia sp.]|jgi:methylenetetrahydrofolate dehydrogenase (NADP+)/methenyltetrahydrofolate cyclohydrolase|uniref:tetrahydrofolate dehydrogenase/cyclohydrolase catalytic domain-containing protein n=1 Tax=uncultured Pseudonocardia sp. TaxID=211455 RepID=UPI00260FC8E0|nr:tetrahydrofolate dehydrogenase/cyclohydrolase catalytic domain-containing protein [uncultured Pseudonocardia sp.]
MSGPAEQARIPGRAILREVTDAYQTHRATIADRNTRVLIVRFEPSPGATPQWASRMHASEVSAQQKTRVFTTLGATVENIVLPDTASASQLAENLETANTDPEVAAVIVQSPPPARLVDQLDRIRPDKDIDALGVDTTRPACATADGITRIAAAYLDATHPDAAGDGHQYTVAVVGSRGFVGSGVVAILQAQGHPVLELDAGDELRQVRDVDIVISTTGRAGLLTAEHLHRDHVLVIDSGFIPHPGPIGDVHPSATHLPRAITPVPGGIGPIEMAVLAERLTIDQAAPGLPHWRYLPPCPADPTAPVTTAAHDITRARAAAPSTTQLSLVALTLCADRILDRPGRRGRPVRRVR